MEPEQARAIFDAAAADYDAVRPGYPESLGPWWVEVAGLDEGDRVLEVGCGTGQWTRMHLGRGLRWTALEPGRALAETARTRLQADPGVTVHEQRFEDVEFPAGSLDALVAATSFHWTEPAERVVRPAQWLRPGGTMTIVVNRHARERDDPALRRDLDVAYAKIPPELDAAFTPLARKTSHVVEAFDAAAPFNRISARELLHTHTLQTRDYLRLLGTFSFQGGLPDAVRTRLLAEIEAAVDRHGGRVTLHYEARAFVWRRV